MGHLAASATRPKASRRRCGLLAASTIEPKASSALISGQARRPVGRPYRSPRDILVRVSELARNVFAPSSAVRWPLRGELRMPLQPAIAGVTHAAVASFFYLHTALLAAIHIPGSSWAGIFVL